MGEGCLHMNNRVAIRWSVIQKIVNNDTYVNRATYVDNTHIHSQRIIRLILERRLMRRNWPDYEEYFKYLGEHNENSKTRS